MLTSTEKLAVKSAIKERKRRAKELFTRYLCVYPYTGRPWSEGELFQYDGKFIRVSRFYNETQVYTAPTRFEDTVGEQVYHVLKYKLGWEVRVYVPGQWEKAVVACFNEARERTFKEQYGKRFGLIAHDFLHQADSLDGTQEQTELDATERALEQFKNDAIAKLERGEIIL